MKKTTQYLDIFTRILATENLSIVVDPAAPTAYIDMKTRVITIPDWSDLSKDQQILLRAHEASHAMNTPPEGWHSSIEEQGKPFAGVLNIVEDARIERMIKDQYPGLRNIFSKAYNEFLESNLFGVKTSEEVNKMNLVDRFNMHFKCGHKLVVNFSDKEQALVDEGERITTFEESVELAKKLYEAMDEEECKKSVTYVTAETEMGTKTKLADHKNVINIRYTQKSAGSLDQRLVNIDADTSTIRAAMTSMTVDSAKNGTRAKVVGGIINTFFEQFKSARNFERTRLHKTGSLNCSRLYEHTYGDDIFLSNESVMNGKNHALVMIVDFSSSMRGVMGDTMRQLVSMINFCDRQNIPYDIYGFYCRGGMYGYSLGNNHGAGANELMFGDNFKLLRMFSYRYGKQKNLALKEFFLKWGLAGMPAGPLNQLGAGFSASSTPLVSSIWASYELVRRVKMETKAEVVHPVYLTDGGGDDSINVGGELVNTYDVINFTDEVNGLTFMDSNKTYRNISVVALEVMKTMGHNPTNFFVMESPEYMNYYSRFFSGDANEETIRTAINEFSSKGFSVLKDPTLGMKEVYLMSMSSSRLQKSANADRIISKKFVEQICGNF